MYISRGPKDEGLAMLEAAGGPPEAPPEAGWPITIMIMNIVISSIIVISIIIISIITSMIIIISIIICMIVILSSSSSRKDNF